MAKHFKDSPEQRGRAVRQAPVHRQATARTSRRDAYGTYGSQGAYAPNDFDYSHFSAQSKRKRRGKTVAIVIACVLVALLAVGGTCGFMLYNSVKNVKAQAQSAVTLAKGAVSKVKDGDFTSVASDLRQLDAMCDNIKDETDGLLWTLASCAPVYGGDVKSARVLVSALCDVSDSALVPLADSLSSATPGKLFADGVINVSVLQAVADSLADAAPVITGANESVQGIGNMKLAQLQDYVDKAKSAFSTLSSAVDAADEVAPLLPGIFGADGQTRNYLVVAENNVEIRANGGYGGAQGIISVTDGVMTINDFQPKISMGIENALPVTDEEEALFNYATGEMGDDSGDALFTPDFPRAASLISQMWEITYGDHVDGVVALDPVFLQYLLGVVGGTTLPDGSTMDGTNAAKVLMHDVYWNYDDTDIQDAMFSAAASAAFDKVLGGLGGADLKTLLSAVTKGFDEGRFIAWMENADEEALVKKMGIDAALPDASDTSAAPVAGVYVNNIRGSKMDWFLDKSVSLGTAAKNADGSTSYPVSVTLSSALDPAEEDSLPWYVTGVPKGQPDWNVERVAVLLYAPAGGSITGLQTSGDLAPAIGPQELTHNGLQVFNSVINLKAAQSITFSYTVTVPAAAGDQPLTVRSTPTCQDAR